MKLNLKPVLAQFPGLVSSFPIPFSRHHERSRYWSESITSHQGIPWPNLNQHFTKFNLNFLPNKHLSRQLHLCSTFQHQKRGTNWISQEFNKHHSIISPFIFICSTSTAWDQDMQFWKKYKNLSSTEQFIITLYAP